MSRGFFILAIAFLLLFLLFIVSANITGVQGDASPAADLLIIEWIVFTIVSFYLAFRPPIYKRWVQALVIACYVFIAIGNLMFVFAGGDCFDLYGNVYPYAGLNPYVWQVCVPLM